MSTSSNAILELGIAAIKQMIARLSVIKVGAGTDLQVCVFKNIQIGRSAVLIGIFQQGGSNKIVCQSTASVSLVRSRTSASAIHEMWAIFNAGYVRLCAYAFMHLSD